MNRYRILASVVLAMVLSGTIAARADNTKEYAPTPPKPAAATLNDAEHKIAASDYKGAIPILAAIVKADPKNTDALNLMGYSYRKTGQTDLALQYYNKALALSPKHLGANEYLGELYVELGQIDKAKERLAVLQAACGNCAQTRDLAAFIAKAGAKG